ncbi:hypothetical protein [Helicobacter sp. 23-1045]
MSEAKTTKQFAELDKETSASPCFASEAKTTKQSKKSKNAESVAESKKSEFSL